MQPEALCIPHTPDIFLTTGQQPDNTGQLGQHFSQMNLEDENSQSGH